MKCLSDAVPYLMPRGRKHWYTSVSKIERMGMTQSLFWVPRVMCGCSAAGPPEDPREASPEQDAVCHLICRKDVCMYHHDSVHSMLIIVAAIVQSI